MIPQPPASTLFPYTTLFRSSQEAAHRQGLRLLPLPARLPQARHRPAYRPARDREQRAAGSAQVGGRTRSEEYTSELQSRQYLVCRLLLVKKSFTTTSRGTLR